MNAIDLKLSEYRQVIAWTALRFGRNILPSLDDRIQAARIGAWKAITSYDQNRGTKLSVYMVRLARNEIVNVGRKERRVHYILSNSLCDATPCQLPTPEEVCINQEESERLSTNIKKKIQRKYTRNGATWTAMDVVELLSEGHNNSDIARKFNVSRERIRQVVKTIRDSLKFSKIRF